MARHNHIHGCTTQIGDDENSTTFRRGRLTFGFMAGYNRFVIQCKARQRRHIPQ